MNDLHALPNLVQDAFECDVSAHLVDRYSERKQRLVDSARRVA